MEGFTNQEQELMDDIVKIHNSYMKLEQQHPSDQPEWVNAIHQLQRIIGMRILRREIPETFPIYKQDEGTNFK